MANERLIEVLLSALSKAERRDLFSRANVKRDADQDLRLTPLSPDDVHLVVPLLLQRISISDADFVELTREGAIPLRPVSTRPEIVVTVPVPGTACNSRLAITGVSAASLALWEISIRVSDVLGALNISEELNPPQVAVRPGSVSFSIGGGTLLVSGIGFVIAAHGVLPLGAAAAIAYWGGSLASGLGIVDMILSWHKTLAETAKFQAETEKLCAESGKLVAETDKISAEARKLQLEALVSAAGRKIDDLERARAANPPPPAASFIPQEVMKSQARNFGIDEAVAAHLANRVLPVIAELNTSFPGGMTASSGSSTQSATSASAS